MEVVFILVVLVVHASGQDVQLELIHEERGYNQSSGAFRWKNCDIPDHDLPLTFTMVKVTPDPLQLAGETFVFVQFMMWFNLTQELGADHNQIEVDLTLRLKTPSGYIEICEIVGERFCHYNDLCEVLAEQHSACKQLEYCKCPFEARAYELPPIDVKVNALPVLVKGTFEATAFVKQQGKHVGCLEVHFCVTECMFD